jgi:hypothetical protein
VGFDSISVKVPLADRGTLGGPAIVAGNSSESLLYRRDHRRGLSTSECRRGRARLSDANIETLKRWIDQGAEWKLHWSFQPPARPAPPAVTDATWPRNPIDNFVLARLERDGLRPSHETDRATLLRRVTLDLTGLPPTLAESRRLSQGHVSERLRRRGRPAVLSTEIR